MSLPTLTLTLRLTDPEWEAIFVPESNQAINMDSYQKDFEVEVEVVQLNLNTGGMRIRFPWPNKHKKSGMGIESRDVSINEFFKHYEIKELV
jgi:hypothetical protein